MTDTYIDIDHYEYQQDLIPLDLRADTFGHPGQTGLPPFPLPSVPMGFHLVGLEFSSVGKVRIPPARMSAPAGLDALYDDAWDVRSLEAYAFNAPIPAPKALHPASRSQCG